MSEEKKGSSCGHQRATAVAAEVLDAVMPRVWAAPSPAWPLRRDSGSVRLPRIEPWHVPSGRQTPTQSSGNLSHVAQLLLNPQLCSSKWQCLHRVSMATRTDGAARFIRACLRSASQAFVLLNNHKFTLNVIPEDSWYKPVLSEVHT